LIVEGKHVVGIDLGTSNSAIAVVQDGEARVVEGTDGLVTPSCVAVLEVYCLSMI
jgi:molecular chaperone DnaK